MTPAPCVKKTPVLYGYWRSGAAYRARIGLELKGLAYEHRAIDLRSGQQHQPDFTAMNPQGLVPALEIDGQVLSQSLAILEYLEETHPEPPLLPQTPGARAQARAMAEIIACDIHPLNNLRVLKALTRLELDEPRRNAWAAGWIETGFAALEQLIARHGRGWAFGEHPGIVECCLIPQIYSAGRFGADLTRFPRIREIDARAAEHPAFQAAHPNRQPDAD